MILRNLTVKGWRCFINEAKVGPFENGLNIIHGPNGIGKSSLIMALTRCLFDSHNVGGDGIKRVRSWGRELSPKVTLDFEQNGEQFQLYKQFLVSPVAKLSRKENDRLVPLAEGRAADDRARAILSGQASSRGVTDHRHWGFAQILWASQGNLRINELASIPRATIQDSIGSQLTGAGTEELETKIADAYNQFFTRTGKIKRSGTASPPIIDLQSRLQTEIVRRDTCLQQLDAFETASRRIEELTAEQKTAKEKESELAVRLESNRERVESYQQLTNQQKQLRLEVSSAEERYKNISERINAIAEAESERKKAKSKRKQLSDNLLSLKKAVERDRKAVNLAFKKLKDTRLRRTDVAEARAEAERAARFVRSKTTSDQLLNQIKQLDSVASELKRLRDSRAKIVAPDRSLLKRIVKIARARDDAKLRLDASLIRVKIEFEKETTIEITQAEETGTQQSLENQQLEIEGSPDVEFTIPGVGHFSATGPTNDFQQLRDQWQTAQTAYRDLTADFGSNDLAELERLNAEAESIDHLISHAQTKLNALFNGGNLEQLKTARDQAIEFVKETAVLHPDWQLFAPNPAETAKDAEIVELKFNLDIEEAESAADLANSELKQSEELMTSRESEIEHLASQIAAAEKSIQTLSSDGLDGRARSKKKLESALERDTAAGKLKEVDEQVRQLGDDPSKSQKLLEEQQKAFRIAADSASGKLSTESGRLEQIIADAPYSAFVAAEEQIERLEEEIRRQQKHMNAIQLLHETVVQKKSEVMNALVDPIRNKANHYLNQIVGSRFEQIDFDETLLPQSISPDASTGGVNLEQISGGEQEQVHFAVRMALADIAFPNDRQLVVFDDVFTYTDASRLDRIAGILSESSERFQIILLTCHPERYHGLTDAKFFDLEAITSQKANA